MPRIVQVAHDFTCQWCWIGLSQTKRLKAEFGVEIEWLPFEQWPEDMDFPDPSPPPVHPANRPKTPTRLQFAMAAEGLSPVTARPYTLRTTRAHQAVEIAKRYGVADQLVDRIYSAYWRHGLDIDRIDLLLLLARGLVPGEAEMKRALEELPDRSALTVFDDPAYAKGIYNLPSFIIDGERYAEQPYTVLREALFGADPYEPSLLHPWEYGGIESHANGGKETDEGSRRMVRADVRPYRAIEFPAAPLDRPTVVMNMVATIDGKILSGGRDEAVMDLGSQVDHETLRQLEHSVQAVMIGAGTLRATKGIWYPKHLFRFVVSRSGALDRSSRFFTDVPERAFVVTASPDGNGEDVLQLGTGEVDFHRLLTHLRQNLGIETLLVEGGSELNAQFLERELADELFLTIAPKIKLGRETPTYAGGEPLPRERIQNYTLLEHHQVGSEIFLRYRRERVSV
ncbi:MAG: dihydrofolate reductase family protein [Fimbriimonadaceae bacterium]|nr:dihydrofolate reductase family protein [Fimbriimonadaceae bacterium]